MDTRNRLWLVLGALLGGAATGCASGVGGEVTDSFDAAVAADASGDADDEDIDGSAPDDAGELPDAAEPLDAADAALDTGEAGPETGPTLDTGTADGAPEAAVEAAVPDAAPDTGADTGAPISTPLPSGPKYGEWTWVQVEGALCRDGSPAGYYHRRGDDNLMIFLNGSGACMDKFFCDLIPKNVGESMLQETLGETADEVFVGPNQTRQIPPNDGILKRDSRNPVANWSMIFVPYCTGDVHGGANPNGNVPNVGPQKFVGHTNIGLFLNSFGPSFTDTKPLLLAGAGAGGFGVLLNFERVQTFFDARGAKVLAVTDSGIPFQDAYLEPCLQKRWRELWNLNAILPQSCTGCRNADGGGLAKGLGTYLFKEKYKDRMLGGIISSQEDEIVKVFFSAGLRNCSTDTFLEAIAQITGLGAYMTGRFPKGISDAITNVAGADNTAYYLLNGSRHMHLQRPRFYEDNGVGQTLAAWVGDVIAEKPTHRGTLAPLP
jgi:hypothetical protein